MHNVPAFCHDAALASDAQNSANAKADYLIDDKEENTGGDDHSQHGTCRNDSITACRPCDTFGLGTHI